MADTTALKNRIKAAIKANDNQEITGPVLQQTLLDIVDELDLYPELQEAINTEKNARQSADNTLQNAINAIKANIDNGYVYAGIATPTTTPVSGKVFYIATAAGTYTNFGGQVLTQGINILRFNGSVWSNQQLIGIDDEPTVGSNNLVKSGGVYIALEGEPNYISDSYLNNSGAVAIQDGYCVSDWIQLTSTMKSNGVIAVSGVPTTFGARACLYDSNKEIVKWYGYGTTGTTTISASDITTYNAEFIRFSFVEGYDAKLLKNATPTQNFYTPGAVGGIRQYIEEEVSNVEEEVGNVEEEVGNVKEELKEGLKVDVDAFQRAMLNDKGLVFEQYIEENIIYNTGDGHRQEYAGYNSCVIAVEPNSFYQMWGVQITEGYGVLAYGDTVDVNGFISYLTPQTGNNARITNRFKTPANCHYVAINIQNTTDISGKKIYKIKPEVLVNSAAIYMANTVFDNTGDYKYYASMDSLFVAVKPSTNYKLSIILKYYTDFIVVQYDKDMNFISPWFEVKGNRSFLTDQNAAYIGINIPHKVIPEQSLDVIECLNFNPRIMTGQPSFAEFKRADPTLNDSVVSVGMLGNTEANLSFNMDYHTGTHKYYDSTVGASWLAMSSGGGAIQWSPSGHDNTGDHDIWNETGKNMVLCWTHAKGRLVVGTNSDEEQGDAAVTGNRQLSGGITFAGLTDCVIEGNRKKGTRGSVSINAYNDGDVSIAAGGGATRIGGKLILKDVAAPSSSSDTGEKGEVRFDSNYVYICVATNTWKRFALETW